MSLKDKAGDFIYPFEDPSAWDEKVKCDKRVTQPTKPPQVRIKKFEGDQLETEDFLVKYEDFAWFQGWEEKEMIRKLALYVNDPIREMYCRSNREITKWEQTKEFFMSNFAPTEKKLQEMSYRAKMNITQRPNEPVRLYAWRIKEASKALGNKIEETHLIEVFLEGIYDSELRKYLRLEEGTTSIKRGGTQYNKMTSWAEVVEMSLKWEVEAAFASLQTDQPENRNSISKKDIAKRKITKRCKICNRRNHNPELCRTVYLRCKNCGNKGHYAKECTNPSTICRKCQKPGYHFKKCSEETTKPSKNNGKPTTPLSYQVEQNNDANMFREQLCMLQIIGNPEENEQRTKATEYSNRIAVEKAIKETTRRGYEAQSLATIDRRGAMNQRVDETYRENAIRGKRTGNDSREDEEKRRRKMDVLINNKTFESQKTVEQPMMKEGAEEQHRTIATELLTITDKERRTKKEEFRERLRLEDLIQQESERKDKAREAFNNCRQERNESYQALAQKLEDSGNQGWVLPPLLSLEFMARIRDDEVRRHMQFANCRTLREAVLEAEVIEEVLRERRNEEQPRDTTSGEQQLPSNTKGHSNNQTSSRNRSNYKFTQSHGAHQEEKGSRTQQEQEGQAKLGYIETTEPKDTDTIRTHDRIPLNVLKVDNQDLEDGEVSEEESSETNTCRTNKVITRCQNCRRTSHTTNQCVIVYTFCIVCGRRNHRKEMCWYRYCSKCGRKGHPEDRCLLLRPQQISNKVTTKNVTVNRNDHPNDKESTQSQNSSNARKDKESEIDDGRGYSKILERATTPQATKRKTRVRQVRPGERINMLKVALPFYKAEQQNFNNYGCGKNEQRDDGYWPTNKVCCTCGQRGCAEEQCQDGEGCSEKQRTDIIVEKETVTDEIIIGNRGLDEDHKAGNRLMRYQQCCKEDKAINEGFGGNPIVEKGVTQFQWASREQQIAVKGNTIKRQEKEISEEKQPQLVTESEKSKRISHANQSESKEGSDEPAVNLEQQNEITDSQGSGNSLSLMIKINDQPTKALLDTGASKSVLNINRITRKFRQRMKPYITQATGIDGEIVKINGTLECKVKFQNQAIIHTFIVMKSNVDAVIGTDLMPQLLTGMKLDFETLQIESGAVVRNKMLNTLCMLQLEEKMGYIDEGVDSRKGEREVYRVQSSSQNRYVSLQNMEVEEKQKLESKRDRAIRRRKVKATKTKSVRTRTDNWNTEEQESIGKEINQWTEESREYQNEQRKGEEGKVSKENNKKTERKEQTSREKEVTRSIKTNQQKEDHAERISQIQNIIQILSEDAQHLLSSDTATLIGILHGFKPLISVTHQRMLTDLVFTQGKQLMVAKKEPYQVKVLEQKQRWDLQIQPNCRWCDVVEEIKRKGKESWEEEEIRTEKNIYFGHMLIEIDSMNLVVLDGLWKNPGMDIFVYNKNGEHCDRHLNELKREMLNKHQQIVKESLKVIASKVKRKAPNVSQETVQKVEDKITRNLSTNSQDGKANEKALGQLKRDGKEILAQAVKGIQKIAIQSLKLLADATQNGEQMEGNKRVHEFIKQVKYTDDTIQILLIPWEMQDVDAIKDYYQNINIHHEKNVVTCYRCERRKTCHCCGTIGHIARNCRNKALARQQNYKQDTLYTQNRFNNTTEGANYMRWTGPKLMLLNAKQMRSLNQLTKEPSAGVYGAHIILEIEINDQKTNVIVDTGACASAINIQNIPKQMQKQIRKSDTKATGINGEGVVIKGKLICKVRYKGQTIQHEFLVMILDGEAVMGTDLIPRILTGSMLDLETLQIIETTRNAAETGSKEIATTKGIELRKNNRQHMLRIKEQFQGQESRTEIIHKKPVEINQPNDGMNHETAIASTDQASKKSESEATRIFKEKEEMKTRIEERIQQAVSMYEIRIKNLEEALQLSRQRCRDIKVTANKILDESRLQLKNYKKLLIEQMQAATINKQRCKKYQAMSKEAVKDRRAKINVIRQAKLWKAKYEEQAKLNKEQNTESSNQLTTTSLEGNKLQGSREYAENDEATKQLITGIITALEKATQTTKNGETSTDTSTSNDVEQLNENQMSNEETKQPKQATAQKGTNPKAKEASSQASKSKSTTRKQERTKRTMTNPIPNTNSTVSITTTATIATSTVTTSIPTSIASIMSVPTLATISQSKFSNQPTTISSEMQTSTSIFEQSENQNTNAQQYIPDSSATFNNSQSQKDSNCINDIN